MPTTMVGDLSEEEIGNVRFRAGLSREPVKSGLGFLGVDRKQNAVEKFKATQIAADVTDKPISFKDLKKGGMSKKKDKVERPSSKSFGLPSNRLPTFEELGGAIGNIAKFIGGLTRFNKARGLAPGIPVTETKDTGLSTKDEANILVRELDTIGVSTERKKEISARLKSILSGGSGLGAIAGDDEAADLEAIRNLP